MKKQDLKQIKEVIDDSISSNNKVLKKELMLGFGEFVEDNINPQFDLLNEKLDKMDESRHQDRGDCIAKAKRGDKKINKLTRILHHKKILTKTELKQLEQVK